MFGVPLWAHLFFFFKMERRKRMDPYLTWILNSAKMYKFQTEKVQRSHSKGYRRESLYFFQHVNFLLLFWSSYIGCCLCTNTFTRDGSLCVSVSAVFLFQFFFFFKKGLYRRSAMAWRNYLQSPQWANSMRVSIIGRGNTLHTHYPFVPYLVSCSLFDPTSWRCCILMKNIGVVRRYIRPLRALTSPATSYMHDNNVRHYSIGPGRRENDNQSEYKKVCVSCCVVSPAGAYCLLF